jgi:hypothetical protein
MYAMVCNFRNFRNFRNICTFEETFNELSLLHAGQS